MGLDVYKLKIVRNYSGELTQEAINEQSNIHLIVKSEFERYLGTKNNLRLNDLFEKFKDSVQKVLVQYYDLKYYSDKYNANIADVNYIFPDQIDFYVNHNGFTELKGKYKRLDEFSTIKLLIDENGKLIYHTCKQLKMINTYQDALIFESTGYQRSGDLPELYDRFYGDCWYKKENTGLKPEDQRWFIFGSELDELKQCFIPDCKLQEWDLYSSELIYLNP